MKKLSVLSTIIAVSSILVICLGMYFVFFYNKLSYKAFNNQFYMNYCASGETGELLPDGTIKGIAGLDYEGENDTREGTFTGNWRFEHEKFYMDGTTLSDGTYETYEKQKATDGSAIYDFTEPDSCGVVVGSSLANINKYIDGKF